MDMFMLYVCVLKLILERNSCLFLLMMLIIVVLVLKKEMVRWVSLLMVLIWNVLVFLRLSCWMICRCCWDVFFVCCGGGRYLFFWKYFFILIFFVVKLWLRLVSEIDVEELVVEFNNVGFNVFWVVWRKGLLRDCLCWLI